MSTPILRTKLYTPPLRAQSVPRRQLHIRLDRALQQGNKLTLIAAPAGFGKTTLVCNWLNRVEHARTWLALDEGDNEPTRFLTYLIAAFQQVDPTIGKTVQPILESPQPPPLESLVTTLINEIAISATHAILVLDDYHVINAQPIHTALTFLLDNLPTQLHLVITSRADPPLPLSRLRARGQMYELREDDLRFSVAEATTFLNDVMGLAVLEKDVQALETRTEGWITGLQLAALSMQGRADITNFINNFTGNHRYILDYLTDEVLDRQPSAIKQFLLRTSILERMCAPLCDAILSDEAERLSPSREFLETLDGANLFMIALDDERHWYRYHHLFGSLLRHSLAQEMGMASVTTLHQRASQWYSQNGFHDEALDHALAAADYDRVVQLLEPLFWAVLKEGEVNTLGRWLRKLPEDLIHNRPKLSIFYAWMLLSSLRLDEIDPYIRNAEQLLATEDDPDSHLLGQIDMINAFLVRVRGNAPEAIRLYSRALTQISPDKEIVRGVLLVDLGRAYVMTDQLEKAKETLLEAIALNKSIGYMQMALYGVSVLAEVEVNQGHPHQAIALYEQTVREMEARDEPAPPIIADLYASLAQLYREWNDLKQARQYAEQAIGLGEKHNFPDGLFQGYLALGQIQQGQGDFTAATQSFQEAERIIRRSQTAQWIISFTAYQARLWLLQHQVDGDEKKRQAGLSWAYTSALGEDWHQQVATAFLPSHPPDFTHLTMARILMARGEPDEAIDLLEWLSSPAQSAGRVRSMIEILMLQALALFQKEQRQRAYAALGEALALAEPAGSIRLFADEGPQMAALLAAFNRDTNSDRPVASTSSNHSYLEQLLLACSTAQPNNDSRRYS